MNDAKVILSDEEIICTWMEPKPEACLAVGSQSHPSMMAWWVSGYRLDEYYWYSRHLTLDALWHVEERLKRQPRGERSSYYEYQSLLSKASDGESWHADAPTRIKALVAVLRPIVEASNA